MCATLFLSFYYNKNTLFSSVNYVQRKKMLHRTRQNSFIRNTMLMDDALKDFGKKK